ncbi:MAG: dTMP kinase [Candidatus Woesearchaeota archaeon]
MHIILEGLDGTGKTTLLNALSEELEAKKVFDVVEFEKIHDRKPLAVDVNRGVALQEADVVLVAEPTHSGIGRVIRSELIGITSREYSQETLAQAYALDREILLKTIVLPALKRGQTVVQSRSWISSIIYQKALNKELSVSELRAIPGNILAEQYLPTAVIYTRVATPKQILKRMKGRNYDKHENLEVQTKVFAAYESEWFRMYLETIGLKWIEVDVSGEVHEGVKNFLEAYRTLK